MFHRNLPALCGLLIQVGVAGAGEISFRNEVMAVLSRGGCNAGACHGNQNGKNGFKLSLRGEDPDADWLALTRDTLGRRVNRTDPASSLILAKPAGDMPHEGGRRFTRTSAEYGLLRDWIAQGARRDSADAPVLRSLTLTPGERIVFQPETRVQLQVEALFSDGSKRDVTGLAVYEPSSDIASVDTAGLVHARRSGEVAILVRYLDQQTAARLAFVPARPNFAWKAPAEVNFIDRLVFVRLRKLRIRPSEICSDSVFLRRLYLDTLGVLPTADEARQFLADPRADRRERAIEHVLSRPEFAEFWALKWSDLLRNEEKVLDTKGVQVYHDWIRRSMADGKPLNEFARELISARGSTYSNPPANYYRALRDPQVRAETTAQVFLGVRLQCARCHNHPFDRWKQDDYHALSGFFARVQYRIVDNKRTDKLDKHEFIGDQVVWTAREGEVKHPRTGEMMSPRFLGGSAPKLKDDSDRIQALADWVADPANPFFARAQANRIWYHLMGRGIVEPNDDFRASNPPANPELLDALAKDLAASRFDLRSLSRAILRSRIYHLSAKPNETNSEDESNSSRAIVRRLQAEQLLDAMSQVTGVSVEFSGHPLGTRAGQLPGTRAAGSRDQKQTEGDRFLQSFGKPVRSLACECERSTDETLPQALLMIGSPLLDGMLTKADNRLGKLLAAKKTDAEITDELFLAAVCRFPTAQERESIADHLSKGKARRQGFEDILWALLNSKEFLLCQ